MNTVKFNKGSTKVIAHRGLSGLETENTNAAFVAAGNRSYFGIETDIHRTADGRFVISHDDTLKRVAGVDVSVKETSLDVSESVILFDTDGTKDRADLRPSRLENYISICKKYEKHAVLELKSPFTDEDTAEFIRIIGELGYLEHTTFISFYYENLKRVRKLIPTQSVQFLFFKMEDGLIDRLLRDRFDVDIEYLILTRELTEKLHSVGLKINVWTVDDPEIAEMLASWGVDYITSNILE